MKRRKIYIIIITLMCTITPIRAQWEAPLNQYWEVKNYYNPSFAGSSNNIETSALYRYQWAGIENSPQRAIITISARQSIALRILKLLGNFIFILNNPYIFYIIIHLHYIPYFFKVNNIRLDFGSFNEYPLSYQRLP